MRSSLSMGRIPIQAKSQWGRMKYPSATRRMHYKQNRDKSRGKGRKGERNRDREKGTWRACRNRDRNSHSWPHKRMLGNCIIYKTEIMQTLKENKRNIHHWIGYTRSVTQRTTIIWTKVVIITAIASQWTIQVPRPTTSIAFKVITRPGHGHWKNDYNSPNPLQFRTKESLPGMSLKLS